MKSLSSLRAAKVNDVRSSVRRKGSVICLLGLLLVFTFSTSSAAAFPFERNSNVTELTPATFPAFINTHKPVVVLFYAPWCGHCKQFHPQYVKFASNVKGVIRVGAIDADQYNEFAHQYSVKGFPTVKYWQMGKSSSGTTTTNSASSQNANEYHGPRTAAALQNVMVSELLYDKVFRANNKATLRQIVERAPSHKAAVLFSAKDKIPAMWSVLSYSPKLQEMSFVFVGKGKDNELANELHVDAFPSIFVISTSKLASDKSKFDLKPYSGNAKSYETIGRFLLKSLYESNN